MSSSTASGAAEPDRAARRRARLVVAAIFAVCAIPLSAALVAYFFWPPSGRTNYGELIEPRPLPAIPLTLLDGKSLSLADLKGRWIMIQADSTGCGAACRAKLLNMRQVRLAQGP